MSVTPTADCHTMSDLLWPCDVYAPTQTSPKSCQTDPVYQEPKVA